MSSILRRFVPFRALRIKTSLIVMWSWCGVACSVETSPAVLLDDAGGVDERQAELDASTCDALLARIRDFDGPRSCGSADDCHLLGAYYIRPRGNDSPPEGVFVSDADKPLADMLLSEAAARACIGPDCAVDGDTYRAACVAGKCIAERRCCNCPPYPGAGCQYDGTAYSVGDVVLNSSGVSCICLDDGGIGHCTGAL